MRAFIPIVCSTQEHVTMRANVGGSILSRTKEKKCNKESKNFRQVLVSMHNAHSKTNI